ncbi:MAG TPA: MBL fold metallo-hydrolase [Acidimicrobiia bacterium]|nr:MBL fold metallo-hydrolase [Acidimicrobiia bacterium]
MTCGVEQAATASEEPPARCPICDDERQYVGWDGQRWTRLATLAAEGRRNRFAAEGPGLCGIGTEPSFAIGQRALLVETPDGNVLWDCISYVDEETVAEVERRGGLAAVAVSHPHYYGVLTEWSEAFGGVPVWIHEADREWLGRTGGGVRLWSGDRVSIGPGLTLVNCGVHFAGGAVLHWAGGEGGRGALLSGDIFQVVMDRRWVGFMYSYPNLIPERPAVVERAVALVRDLPFESIYGAWWGRNVRGGAKDALARSAERYLARVTPGSGA